MINSVGENISHDDDTLRVAVICFLPDMGHVLPLLRFVHFETKQRAMHVACFLASRFEPVVLEHGFDFHGLTSLDEATNKDVFAKLSRKSNFYNAFSGFAVLADEYWAPISQSACGELDGLAAKLATYRPHLIIADDHVFSDYYKMIADAYGARLVLHRSNGSLLPYRRPFVYAYGLNSTPSWAQGLVELAGRAHRRIVRYWRLLTSPNSTSKAEAARASLKRSAENLFGGNRADGSRTPVRVACGTGVFEKDDFPTALPLLKTDEIFLPPLVVPAGELLAPEIENWISQQSRKIVYVSFGTLICPNFAVLRSLARGLKSAGAAVLWALPSSQGERLREEGLLTKEFFFADFLPQTALLFSGHVSCFVTHAGANSIHESLTAAVPMLCIPIIYDQHYNASVAVCLGSALKLSRRKANSDNIRACVEKLLHNPGYAQRAREITAEIRERRDDLMRSRSWADRIFRPDFQRRDLPPTTMANRASIES